MEYISIMWHLCKIETEQLCSSKKAEGSWAVSSCNKVFTRMEVLLERTLLGG